MDDDDYITDEDEEIESDDSEEYGTTCRVTMSLPEIDPPADEYEKKLREEPSIFS